MINARTPEENQSGATMTPREDEIKLAEQLEQSQPRSTSSCTSSPSPSPSNTIPSSVTPSQHGSFEKLGLPAATGVDPANPPPMAGEAKGEAGNTASTTAASSGGVADEEWSKLRCGSLCTEELARKEKQREDRQRQRQNRCADYPGFAFGSAMFGSDTTMKFNIIKNELHNIMRSQLKRVEGEVNALSSRVKQFDTKLEESEKYIRESTSALAEAVALQIEESKNQSEEAEQESNLSAFDQHVLFLEAQLREARVKARQSVQILEDCHQEQISLLSTTTTTAAASAGLAVSPPNDQQNSNMAVQADDDGDISVSLRPSRRSSPKVSRLPDTPPRDSSPASSTRKDSSSQPLQKSSSSTPISCSPNPTVDSIRQCETNNNNISHHHNQTIINNQNNNTITNVNNNNKNNNHVTVTEHPVAVCGPTADTSSDINANVT